MRPDLPDTDHSYFAVVVSVIDDIEDWLLEYPAGRLEADTVLRNIGLIFGCVPFEHDALSWQASVQA
jgi:hypothetical protein